MPSTTSAVDAPSASGMGLFDEGKAVPPGSRPGAAWDSTPQGIAEDGGDPFRGLARSEENTSELQSLMRISYAVLCFKKQKLPYTFTFQKYTFNPLQPPLCS